MNGGFTDLDVRHTPWRTAGRYVQSTRLDVRPIHTRQYLRWFPNLTNAHHQAGVMNNHRHHTQQTDLFKRPFVTGSNASCKAERTLKNGTGFVWLIVYCFIDLNVWEDSTVWYFHMINYGLHFITYFMLIYSYISWYSG